MIIKNIFIPERTNSRFLFPHTALGLEIGKSAFVATKVTATGTHAIVLEFFHEDVHKKDDENIDKSLTIALDILLKKIGSRTKAHLSLPNYVVVYKELTLPFLDVRKIRQTLAFELEQHIPFSINDVVFDFIVTNHDLKAQKTTIFVAIAQKKDIKYFVQLLENVDIDVENITTDLFSLLGLYQAHPNYKNRTEPIAIIDIGLAYTSIAYIDGQAPRAMRSVNLGLHSIAKNISVQTEEEQAVIIQNLIHSGVTNNNTKAGLGEFIEQLKFTLNAFATQTGTTAKSAILVTRSTKIKQLDALLEKELGISVRYFDIDELTHAGVLVLKKPLTSVPNINYLSLGAAFPFGMAGSFDLLASYAPAREMVVVRNQIIAAGILVLGLFGLLCGNWYMQYRNMSQQSTRIKRSITSTLTDKFRLEKKRSYKEAIEAAQEKIGREESIWSGFSKESRTSFLQYLQELSTTIDREATNLALKKVILEKDAVTLIGQVGGLNELKVFEQALENSRMFRPTTRLQDQTFEVKLSIRGAQVTT